MAASLYWNRLLVYSGLTLLGCLMLIDAVPQYTLLHGKLKQLADPVLDMTGLWQGSWELFAPEPDHVNVRIGAIVTWKDHTEFLWLQPDWHSMSPLEKSRSFRKMSWFDGLWKSSNSAAWEPFCRHLAAEQSRQSIREVFMLRLFQDRDVIPAQHVKWRSAYSAPQYTSTSLLYTWSANE